MELVNEIDKSELENVTSAEPTIDSSRAVPKFVFVIDPHVVAFSPVVISSIFKLLLYVLAIVHLRLYLNPRYRVAVVHECPRGAL